LVLQSASTTYASSPSVAFYDTVVTANARNWMIGNIATDYGSFNIASSTSQGGVPETPRFTINKDGNVGIGTTSPADTLSYGRALDIQSSTGGAIYLRDSDAVSVYGFFAYDGGATNRTSIGGIGADNYLRIISAGNEAMRITSAGRLLIGTTTDLGSPYSLQVNGRIVQYGLEFAFIGDEDKRITVFANRALVFATNDTERMRITSAGNVSIGNTNDTYKLDVSGTGRFSDNVTISSNFPTLILSRAGTTFQQDIRFQDSGANRWAIGQAVNAVGNTLDFYSYSYGQVLGLSYTTGAATFSSSVTAVNAVLGNTSNNTNSIQINGVNTTRTHIGSAFGATFIQNNNFFNGSAYVFDDNTVATSNITLSAGTINFQTGLANVNPSTKLTMFSDGNTFIGSSPSNAGFKLDVSGTGRFSGNLQVTTTSGNGLTITTNDVTTLKLNSTGGTKNWGFATTNLAASDFGIYQSNSGGGDPISAGSAKLYFNGTGAATFSSSVTAVGGTASYSTSALPTATISTTTTGAINAAYTSIRIGARGQSGQDQSVAITNVPTNDGNSAIAFTTIDSYSYAERMRITSAGRVGIGTTNPLVPLQVAGSAFIDGGFLYMSNALPIVWGATVSIEGDSSANKLLLNAGSVGIGTTSPSSRLVVKGVGTTTGTTLNVTNSSDTSRLLVVDNGNIGISVTSAFGNGVKVIGISNATTVPNADPSGGGVLYVEAGALKYRGSNGTITTIAPA
jgi:hypothetical protein